MTNRPSADLIAQLSFQKFKSLPKTGKPTKSEWTILSSIIQFDCATDEAKVVALGAGTKCIGQSKLCPSGLILNDSHAEVLARRAFLRYMYHQLNAGSDMFTYDTERCVFRIRDTLRFHFFSTQTPCGDACIISNEEDETPAKRRKVDDECDDAGDVLPTSSVFTGAKLIGQSSGDPMHQTVGALRTKPGRGDRTLSMSCSDKLAKWNILGVQGAFLNEIIEKPIYLETLSFSCEFDMESMTRAIYGRWKDRDFKNERFAPQTPEIRECSQCVFEFAADPERNPSPNGLAWCDIPEEKGPYEVSVNGKKQGITKKALHTRKACLKISKVMLLEDFCEVLHKHPEIVKKLCLGEDNLETTTYKKLKERCTQYHQAWNTLKASYFQQWTTKPANLVDFCLSGCNKHS